MVENCYVEFRADDEARYSRLVAVVDALRADKQAGELTPGPKWRAYFDEQALSHFWWPTPAEAKEHSGRWFAIPVPERLTDPSLETPWDFDSLIDAFANGEYELVGVRRNGEHARIEFSPDAFPYGGSGCMQRLIEAFGFTVLKIDDGSQPSTKGSTSVASADKVSSQQPIACERSGDSQRSRQVNALRRCGSEATSAFVDR